VDPDALAALEFPAVAERVAAAGATDYGAELGRTLAPSPDPDEVARRQALTAEAIGLVQSSAEPELHAIADVRAAAVRASREGVLSPGELRAIAAAVRAGLAARAALEEAEDAPLLRALAEPIEPALAALADELEQRVEPDGSDLRDTASALLRRVRRDVRTSGERVAEELRRLARSRELRAHLQEDFVTQRGGRAVLAVKASARSAVPGVVHDASSSGETLFVEPFAVVELANRRSEAAGEERDEVERILRELSAAVGERAEALRALVEATGAIDLALACAAVSRGWRGTAVEPSAEVRLVAARHPLLDPANAVPIDLELGGLRALVVSGPNTGGKTVALKTLGLAALLHQSGLRPPAAQAALPVFDRVLAVVGDRQSIEMSLSTFSAHLGDLLAVLRAATPRSLVLVDELASGTDPVEGSALAQALMARLAALARLTVVTTHYPELKEWASATDGAANAATAFDPETQEPLYRVAIGRPGTSHALETAERLGLDAGVVADARARIAPERRRVAELLAEAEEAARAGAESSEAAERERGEAVALAEETRAREAELRAEIDAVRASVAGERERAVAEAERDLAEARAELRALRDEIRAARRLQREAGPEAEPERDRRLGEASERATTAERALRSFRPPVPVTGPLAPGDPVEAPELGVRGTIAAIEGDEAEVAGAAGQRIRIPVERLRPYVGGAEPDEPRPAVRVVAAARSDVSDELDLRGQRPEEARAAVRSFVDDAVLAGLASVRVIHGRGTGAVRTAVRDELARHPLVEGFESDSADGATAVTLADGSPR